MDFREMLYITTVADLGSITAASKKLYISQPSLSGIVSKVEQDVGVKLFDRKSYPLTLTYAGEKYVETARKVLALNDNLRRELTDIGSGKKGRIRFGIPTERAGYMLPKVLQQFYEAFPGFEVQLQEANSDELHNMLMKDMIHFFILPRSTRELPEGLKRENIYKEKLLLVTGPAIAQKAETAPAGKKILNLNKLSGETFILIKRGHAIRKKVDTILKQHRLVPQKILEVTSCISAAQLASSGLGVTIVPQRAIEVLSGADQHNCCLYAEEPDTWDVDVVYKKDTYLDRVERYFIDLMKEAFCETE